MANKNEIKWEDVKLDYLAGMKPKDIVIKYNVDYTVLTNKASNNGWTTLLSDKITRFNELWTEQQLNSDFEAINKMQEDERKQADLMAKAVVNKMVTDGKIDDKLSSQDINNLTSSLEKIQKIKYKSYGISDKLDIKAGIELPAVINFTKAE